MRMELGIIGLGRMGASMTERLVKGGHRVVVHDIDSRAIDRAVANGAVGGASIEDFVKQLTTPRAIWLMVPAGEAVEKTLDSLLPLIVKGDVVIDGGNSNYKDTIRRASRLAEKSIEFVDAGTSGGIWGLTQGYCLMIGGASAVVERVRPVFETLAPSKDRGWAHVGPVGAGHFVKMVHNGIEYGLMQSYAEGFALLNKKADFHLDLHQIAELWRHGSVVRSWLLDLTAEALGENPRLEGIQPYVSDSGEGRWTVAEAIDQNISAPVITLSLLERLRSRDEQSFGTKLLALMRNKFGGHAVKKQ
jgi:6-phosphogluconate dehydrogenase